MNLPVNMAIPYNRLNIQMVLFHMHISSVLHFLVREWPLRSNAALEKFPPIYKECLQYQHWTSSRYLSHIFTLKERELLPDLFTKALNIGLTVWEACILIRFCITCSLCGIVVQRSHKSAFFFLLHRLLVWPHTYNKATASRFNTKLLE